MSRRLGIADEFHRPLNSACAQDAPHLRHLLVSPFFANLWMDPVWTEGMLEELRRKRPELYVAQSTSPLKTSTYESLGTGGIVHASYCGYFRIDHRAPD